MNLIAIPPKPCPNANGRIGKRPPAPENWPEIMERAMAVGQEAYPHDGNSPVFMPICPASVFFLCVCDTDFFSPAWAKSPLPSYDLPAAMARSELVFARLQQQMGAMKHAAPPLPLLG